MVEAGGTVRAANAAAGALFGGIAPPVSLARLVGAAAADRIGASLAGPERCEIDCDTADGAARLAVHPSRFSDGLWVLTLERRPRGLPSEQLQAVLDRLPVGVEIFDGNFIELFANTYSARMFGYAPGEIGSLDEWWEVGYPDPDYRRVVRDAWYADVRRARECGGEVDMGEWTATCKDGSRKVVQFRFRIIGELNVLVYWDVTERHRLEGELRTLAATDPLTGMFNRRQFFAEAAAAITQAALCGTPLSLMLLDLDHFKQINDRHGHGVGDRVLEIVSARLRAALAPGELIGRTGGEEFAVLAPSAGRHGAVARARRLIGALAGTPVAVGPLQIGVDTSVGVTSLAAGDDLDELFERADRALYAAKRAGRGRVRFLGPRRPRRRAAE